MNNYSFLPGRKTSAAAQWIAVAVLAIGLTASAPAQISLSGTSYTENFNAIGGGLPAGWTVRTNATAAGLGINANFPTATKSWADTGGEFGNCASLTNNSGVLSTGSESAATQAGYTNRVLAVRQTGSFGDPGAAFVLQIANTLGFSNLNFAADFNLLRSNGYSTTWTIDYAVANVPTAFTTLGTFADPGTVGITRLSFNLGADANDQANNVWIRVAATNAAAGSGTRDTFGIDNVELTYDSAAPAPEPLNIQLAGADAVLTWANPLFNLQSSLVVTGAYTTILGATSPHTNPITGDARFFRLIYP